VSQQRLGRLPPLGCMGMWCGNNNTWHVVKGNVDNWELVVNARECKQWREMEELAEFFFCKNQ